MAANWIHRIDRNSEFFYTIGKRKVKRNPNNYRTVKRSVNSSTQPEIVQ